MMRIDPLLFLFLVEFFLVFLGLSIFLYVRYRNRTKEIIYITKKREDFGRELAREVRTVQEKVKKFSGEEKEVDLETSLVREQLLLRLGYLVAAHDGFEKGEGEYHVFWEHVYSSFSDTVRDVFRRIRDLEQREPPPSPLQGVPADGETGGDSAVLEKRVRELEAELAQKNEECHKLHQEFESLEEEYTKLYNETKGRG